MRLNYIDNLKGFAIILVVLGHIIQYCYAPETYDNIVLFRYIYSFHMALFMMISGYTVKKETNITYRIVITKIKRRAVQLLLPFLTWGVLNSIILKNPFIDIINTPEKGLWFLWVLFFISIGYTLCQFLSSSTKLPLILSLVAMYFLLRIVGHLTHGNFATYQICWYYIFYCIGTFLGSNKDRFLKVNYQFLIPFTTLCYAILGYFWYRDYSIMPPYSSTFIGILTSPVFSFLTGISGCMTFILLFVLLGARLDFCFKKIGGLTLGIYAIHQNLLHAATGLPSIYTEPIFHSILGVIVLEIIVIASCILIIQLVFTNRIASLLLFGKLKN